MKLTERSVSDLLEAVRSPTPTPGGGSASALAGALGASLLAMVAALPKPNATAEEDIRRLADTGARCTALALELEALIDQDSDAYDLVVSAFRMSKGTEEDKTARVAAIQRALIAATEAPLAVMHKCADGLAASTTIAALGNSNASSDVQVAIALLSAALHGAHHNVEINLGSLKDADYVARVRQEALRLLRSPTTDSESA